jgi:hypothetical protein
MRCLPTIESGLFRAVGIAAVLLFGQTTAVQADAILLTDNRQITVSAAISDGVASDSDLDSSNPPAPFSTWADAVSVGAATPTGFASGFSGQESGFTLTGPASASAMFGDLSTVADMELAGSADSGTASGGSSFSTAFTLLTDHPFTLTGTLAARGDGFNGSAFLLTGPVVFFFSSDTTTSFDESGTLPAGDYQLFVNVLSQLMGAEGQFLTGPLDTGGTADASFLLSLASEPTAIPEPATLLLMAGGLSAFAARRRRARASSRRPRPAQ